MQTHTTSSLETLVGSMTLGDLAAKSGISVDTLVQRAFAPIVQRRTAGEERTPTRHQATSVVQYLPLEEAVLTVLRGEQAPIRGDMLRGKVAAVQGYAVTAGELRDAISRSVRDGAKIAVKGKTRGTTYMLLSE